MVAQPVDTGIVTPEAVVLDFETAGFASRLLSGVLDAGLQIAALYAFGLATVPVVLQLPGMAAAIYLAVFAVIFLYPVVFEVLWGGRTPGKAALGLRVVTSEGGPIRFRHAAIRSMMALVDKYLFFGVIGLLMILVTRRNQRLGDLVAGTIVLRERVAGPAPVSVHFRPPPGLEAFTASLDVSRLDHEAYGAVRSFLLRAQALQPAVRWRVASDVAAAVAPKLRAAPPAGLAPEAFLVCVASAFQAAAARQSPSRPSFTSVWSSPGLHHALPARPGDRAPGGTEVAGGYVSPG